MTNRFAGANAKFRWGFEHLERLKVVLQKFAESNPCSITEDNYHEPPLWNVKMVKPFPASLPLIVGDCVQNYRAALDYVAYELGLSSGMNRKQRRQIDFPLAPSNKTFGGRPAARILHSSELAFVKRFQPYRDPPISKNSLRILAYLSNTDKHRKLRFMPKFHISNTTFIPTDGKWNFFTERKIISPRQDAQFRFPVADDMGFSSRTVIAGYSEMNVPDGVELHVHFHERTGYVGGQAIFNVLRRIGVRVEEIVTAAEAEFG